MNDSQLINRAPSSGAGLEEKSRRKSRPIPYDLLKEASQRLQIMSLLAAVLWTLGTIGYRLAILGMSGGDTRWLRPQPTDAISLFSIVMSLGLFFYIRRADCEPQWLLDLGLVYMVFTGMALGLTIHWFEMPREMTVAPMMTWVGAVVLMTAAIIPNSPKKILIAGLLTVSMNPLGMIIAKARGSWDFGPLYGVFIMHYPDYLLAGVAVLVAHVVTKMGQQVSEAREMGSYKLVSLLGKGGMGEVWRASHRMLARDAAIKLIQPEMLSRNPGNATSIRRRFEQEAKATASLRSPHTVELYDFGVTRSGVFYYAMELLDGIDLETLVKKYGPQPPARVVRILRQACRSLADAHSHGLVHRDIKPTNIFLCRLGNEFDYVKVLDFGLVKVLDTTETQLTGEGVTTGTPAYMAPEVALGKTNLDGRTDLYGLGCVAYWLLTGTLLFEENNATAMALAHLQKLPVPPSERSELKVPPCLDQAVLMCLAKEPAQRPATADALVQLLEKCHSTESWTAADAEKWWNINMAGGSLVVVESASIHLDPTILPTIDERN